MDKSRSPPWTSDLFEQHLFRCECLQVMVTFRATREVSVRDQPVLRCQVVEPSLSESGEVIALIPIRLSAAAVFSK